MRYPCPYCKEQIIVGAVVCRFCGRDIGIYMSQESPPRNSSISTGIWLAILAAILNILALALL